jgi:hypothetical protein
MPALPTSLLLLRIYNLLVSVLVAWLSIAAFQQIIDSAFMWETGPGQPVFYLVPGLLSHSQMALLSIALAIAAIAVGGTTISLIHTIKNYKPRTYKGQLWVNGLLLSLLAGAVIYFAFITPVKSEDVGNIGFTMTDGTVANTGLTIYHTYFFYAIAIAAFIAGVVVFTFLRGKKWFAWLLILPAIAVALLVVYWLMIGSYILLLLGITIIIITMLLAVRFK